MASTSDLTAFDWSGTPLGPRETWSPVLATTYDILMASGFAMCAAWGPRRIMLYNDAYVPFLGKRHPGALGRPLDEVWHDVWADISPLVEKAMSGTAVQLTDLHLVMTRNGFPEDTYWTFSYSPVREGDAIAGFLIVTIDTTATVLLNQRLKSESERLHDSESRLLALVTAGAYSLYRMSPDWQEMRRLDGEGILAGSPEPTVRWRDVYIDPADRPIVVAAIDDAIARKGTFELEHRVRLADGSFGWVLSRAVPIIGENGDIIEWFGAASDITARREAAEQQEILNHELSHRLKNTLAIVQSIGMQTLRNAPDLESARKTLSDRLMVLGRAHEVLLSGKAESERLRGLATGVLKSHDERPHRIRIAGPDVAIGSSPALYLTLMLHELATNAWKYGALSTPKGSVDLRWSVAGSPAQFELTWTETGGPHVPTPTRRGFGSRLIEQGLPGAVGGTVMLAYEPEGVVCTLSAPLSGIMANH